MKKYTLSILFGFIFFTFLFSSYTKKHQETIRFFVPYEMHFVAPEIVKTYSKEHKNIKIQIEEYASSEVYSTPKEGIHIIDSWSRKIAKPFLYSPLVILGHRKIYSLEQLQNSSIAIPDPDYNTAGVNVIKILRNENLWDPLKRGISYRSKGILCMESVDLGEEDFAIIPLSDSYFSKNSLLVFSLQEKEEFSMQYRIKNYDKKKETQKQFYEFLRSEKAIKIFEKYGFLSSMADSTKSAQ